MNTRPNVGDIVEYATYGGGIRIVLVTQVEEDIKNEEPGFVGELLVTGKSGLGEVWGYDHQIKSVFRASHATVKAEL